MLHCAMFRTMALLRDKLHENLDSVTAPRDLVKMTYVRHFEFNLFDGDRNFAEVE